MPRAARVKSSAGLYHIMLLGADGKIIFQDEEDCRRFLDTLRKAREGSSFRLYAYCLMGNHVHLLIKEDTATIEQIFKRIGASYARIPSKPGSAERRFATHGLAAAESRKAMICFIHLPV